MNQSNAGAVASNDQLGPVAEALTVARILEIRDALLPSQGEPFDCVAFAVEIVKAERARAADAGPKMPEPYTRQWINAPFTERLLFTEDQMRQYAAAATAEARALADSEGTRAVNYLRRARKAEELLRRCSRHLGQWAEWYGNADHAARGQLPLPPAGDVRLAEDIAEHLTPNDRIQPRR